MTSPPMGTTRQSPAQGLLLLGRFLQEQGPDYVGKLLAMDDPTLCTMMAAVMGAEEAVAVLMPILTHLMRERGYHTAEWRGP